MLTKERLEERLNFVTGSDASVICGVSPWGNIVELWKQKTRQTTAIDISDKPSVRAGVYLEPVVRQWFSDLTGKNVSTDERLLIHQNIPHMAASIDGRVVSDNAVFEAKTAGWTKGWGEDGENIIPDYYLCQVAHYMAVTDCERAYVAVLISGNDFRWYTIERDMRLEETIIKMEKDFWDLVKSKTPPAPRTSDEIISLYGYESDSDPITSNFKVEHALSDLRSTKIAIKEAQEKQKELEETIKIYMGKHNTLANKDGKILASWNPTKPSRRFDSKVFKEDQPELYGQYLSETKPQRRFLIK